MLVLQYQLNLLIYQYFSQIRIMKKSTNKYRRCPNCPHSILDKKCCCQGSSASTMRNRAATSRLKKQQSTIDNSSMINTTVPSMVAQFSALRTQNNQLKRQLLNVSTFLKDDPHSSIYLHHNQPTLSQKLFIANKNYKQSLLQIDNISKINKQLYDRNTHLSQINQGFKIRMKQLEIELDKYRKKCKRYNKTIEEMSQREEIEIIIKKNNQLFEENKNLKEEIRCLRFENKNFSMVGNLSPQWVAHTNNKISKNDHQGRIEDEFKDVEIQVFKRSLSETINLLKNQNSHFTSTSFDNVGDIQAVTMQELIKNLLSTYSESIFGHFTLLIKQMNRKLNNYQKKLGNLTSKLQNFLMIVRNKKLKKKMYPNTSFIKTERHPMADLTNRIL